MATITQKEWKRYIARLRQVNEKAADEFRNLIISRGGYGNIDRQVLIDYAYSLTTKYGEASAALSAQMYDAVAELSGAVVPAAIPAETATYSEVAKTVNGIIKNTGNEEILAQGIGRLVKMAGTDTMLSNAYRDRPKGKGSKRRHSGAQVAWIPSGDTCPFCLMLASKGWQNQTQWAANSHSEHIHANCDCTYAVRFNDNLTFAGYDPDEYKEIYEDAEGSTRNEKFNSMRREYREENKDKINAQKRAAYAANKESKNAIIDVTDEYKKSSTPGVGKIVFDENYDKKSHLEEMDFANWIHNTLGGDIRALSESTIDGQKMPDFIWKERKLELKTISSIPSIDRQIHKAAKQIDEKGIIAIDISGRTEDIEKTIKEIEYRFPKRTRGENDLIIKSGDELLKVIKAKR